MSNQEQQRRKDFEAQRGEERPILDQLAEVGVRAMSLYDVPQITNPDARIYPILFDHLTKRHSPLVLERLGRAFGHKSARPWAWNRLLELLKSHKLQPSAAEGALLSMSEMARPSDLTTLIDLISDRKLGTGRIYLIDNLMRSKKPEAREALEKNKEDPDLTKEINFRLRKNRVQTT